MNLIQQLAEYQNAPMQTLEAAKQGADPAVSPWVAAAIMSDRLEKQKRMQNAQGAAQGPMPTVAEEQDQEAAGIMGAAGAPQMAQAQPQQPPQPQQPQQPAPQGAPTMAAEGGLMRAKMDPRMFDFAGGGIIAFSGEGRSDVPPADDTIYDPVTGLPIAGESTRSGDDITLREALGLGNVENRRALEKLEKELNAPKERSSVRKLSQADGAAIEAREKAAREAGDLAKAVQTPPAGAKPAGAKPAGGPGITGLGSVQKTLTSSPEWAAMEAARTKAFEAPDMGQTAGALAAERAAHLKAQGITEMPWDTAAKQTAELRRIMGEEDAARMKDREDNEKQRRYDTFVANLGGGSFGQSAQGGLRANIKREEDMRAEDQRIKELRYNQKLKLNEIDAKAQELRYNEASGDVAAAQKNRQEIAKLKRDYEKDQATLAKDQATLRERGAAVDATNATTLAAARERMGASQALTPKQIADIRDKAYDNVNNKVKAGGVPLQLAMKKDPGMFERMVQQETDRLLAQMGGGAAPTPVQSQYGPPPQGAVRLKK